MNRSATHTFRSGDLYDRTKNIQDLSGSSEVSKSCFKGPTRGGRSPCTVIQNDPGVNGEVVVHETVPPGPHEMPRDFDMGLLHAQRDTVRSFANDDEIQGDRFECPLILAQNFQGQSAREVLDFLYGSEISRTRNLSKSDRNAKGIPPHPINPSFVKKSPRQFVLLLAHLVCLIPDSEPSQTSAWDDEPNVHFNPVLDRPQQR